MPLILGLATLFRTQVVTLPAVSNIFNLKPTPVLSKSSKIVPMHIPLLGRLSLTEWPLVAISLLLSWLEYISNLITRLLPPTAINLMSYTLQVVYSFTASPIRFISSGGDLLSDGMPDIKYRYLLSGHEFDKVKYDRMTALLNAKDILEMCAVFGYRVELRVIRTTDDYLLTVQRISRPNS